MVAGLFEKVEQMFVPRNGLEKKKQERRGLEGARNCGDAGMGRERLACGNVARLPCQHNHTYTNR